MSQSLRPPRLSRRVGTRPGRKNLPFALLVETAQYHGCFNCGGFSSVQIRVNGVLHTVSCPVCGPSASYIGGGTPVPQEKKSQPTQGGGK